MSTHSCADPILSVPCCVVLSLAVLCWVLLHPACQQGNHIYTSGATGTNAAVIKGALRAENPELLTVILPQSLSRQPQESQELLSQVRGISCRYDEVAYIVAAAAAHELLKQQAQRKQGLQL